MFKAEIVYFSERMTKNLRILFTSSILKSVSSPLMTTFLNAFVFRETGSFIGVVFYNVGQFIGLPTAFYINGILLKRFQVKTLFAWGTIGGTVTAAIFIFLSAHKSLSSILLFGFSWGLSTGFYWSSRNYLELQETLTDMRQYFYGILSTVNILASVLVPVAAGAIIVLLSHSGFSLEHAYWVIFACSLVLMAACGGVVADGSFVSPIPKYVFWQGHWHLFTNRRLLSVASGFTDGAASFIPVLIILTFLGNEGVLGALTGVASLATACAVYIYGRSVTVRRANSTMLFSAILFLGASAMLLLGDKAGYIVYVLFISISFEFFLLASAPILLNLSDEDMSDREELRYALIFDNELFLNVGRLISIAIIAAAAFLFSENVALVYGSIILAAVFVLLVAGYVFKDRSRST